MKRILLILSLMVGAGQTVQAIDYKIQASLGAGLAAWGAYRAVETKKVVFQEVFTPMDQCSSKPLQKSVLDLIPRLPFIGSVRPVLKNGRIYGKSEVLSLKEAHEKYSNHNFNETHYYWPVAYDTLLVKIGEQSYKKTIMATTLENPWYKRLAWGAVSLAGLVVMAASAK